MYLEQKEFPTSQLFSFLGVNMKGCDLEASQMSGVNLRVATMKGANLQNCNLRGAILAGADLEVTAHNLLYRVFKQSPLSQKLCLRVIWDKFRAQYGL